MTTNTLEGEKTRIRSFIALDVSSSNLHRGILPIQNQLGGSDLHIRFVDPDILHLTLKFLGDLQPSDIDRVIAALKSIEFPQFNIHLRGVGVFPNLKRPRVIFIDIHEGKQEVIRLSKLIDDVTIGVGLPPADRLATPHLTIGRVRFKRTRRRMASDSSSFAHQYSQLQNVDLGIIPIVDFHFKESTLTPQGPIYSNIASFALQDSTLPP